MYLEDIVVEYSYKNENDLTILRLVNKQFKYDVDIFINDFVIKEMLTYFHSINMNITLSGKTLFLYCLKYVRFATSDKYYFPPSYISRGKDCIQCRYLNIKGKQCKRTVNYKKEWLDRCWQHKQKDMHDVFEFLNLQNIIDICK